MKKYILPILLLLVASGLVLLYGFCHVAGWRQHTSVLSGSLVDATALSAGMAYVMVYLGAILLAPVLVLTSILLMMFHTLKSRLWL